MPKRQIWMPFGPYALLGLLIRTGSILYTL